MDTASYDIAILGGGNAGLLLALQLIEAKVDRNYSILLIDKGYDQYHHKYWSFWENLKLPYQLKVDHSWNTLKVITSDYSEIQHSSDQFKVYRSIHSSNFIEKAVSKIQASNIDYIKANVTTLKKDELCNTIYFKVRSEIKAKCIFQNIFTPQESLDDIKVKQHFVGLTVEFPKQLLNKNEVVLMDLSIPKTSSALQFMYQLNFNDTTALFELTYFSKNKLDSIEAYTDQIFEYIEKKYSINKADIKILETETASLPMFNFEATEGVEKGIYNLGYSSGCIKASTGYSFMNNLKRARKITSRIDKYVKRKVDPNKLTQPKMYAWMDQLLLDILANQEEYSTTVFDTLYKGVGIKALLKFLSENASFGERIHIMRSVPVIPFIKAAFRVNKKKYAKKSELTFIPPYTLFDD